MRKKSHVVAEAPSSTVYGLDPSDPLNDLRMSDKAKPLFDHVKKFLKETVAPMQGEVEKLDSGKKDP